MTTTTTSTESTEAIRTARDLIERITKSIHGDDASREYIENLLKDQQSGSASTSKAAPEEEPEEAAPVFGALTVEADTITRPNGVDYHVRRIGDHHDVAALQAARAAGINVLAYGPPGTGKTALIEGAFAGTSDDGTPSGRVYTVQGSGDTETADFIGGYVQLPGGVFEWVDGPLVRAMEEGSVMYIDEISLIDPKVLSIVYGVMDGRDELLITQNPERGVVKAADGFYVIAACNPNAPGSRMSEALTSRFSLQIQVTTDYKLARELGVPKRFITAATNLERKREEGSVGWSPQMRECLAFMKLANLLGEKVALRNAVSTAPEIDRPVVADVLSRTFGTEIGELAVA